MATMTQRGYTQAYGMPNFVFRFMSCLLFFRERLSSWKLDSFGIKPGDTVVDFGCGPGTYVRKAAALAGDKGRVYAVDIHDLAMVTVKRKIKKYGLANVTPMLARSYPCSIGDHQADVIFALDMFHMVNRPTPFLKELHRILKPAGRLVIDDGHQPRAVTIQKLTDSKLWTVSEEKADRLVCSPV